MWLVEKLDRRRLKFLCTCRKYIRAQRKSSRLKIFPTKTTCCLWHQRETPTIRYKAPGQSQIKVYLVHWIWLTVCDFLYCYFRTTAVNQFFLLWGAEIHKEMVEGPNFQNDFAVLGYWGGCVVIYLVCDLPICDLPNMWFTYM